LLHGGEVLRGTVSRVDGTTVHVFGHDPIEADYVVFATGSTYPFPAKYSSYRSSVAKARLEQLHENLGRARSVMIVGGGTVHGPQPRDYTQRTPKKMKAAALRSALSDRARNGRVHVITEFVTTTVPSTKNALVALRNLTDRKALVIVDRQDDLSRLSLRNAPEAHVLWADQLNTYDVLKSDDVVFTASGLDAFLGKGEEESK